MSLSYLAKELEIVLPLIPAPTLRKALHVPRLGGSASPPRCTAAETAHRRTRLPTLPLHIGMLPKKILQRQAKNPATPTAPQAARNRPASSSPTNWKKSSAH